MKSESNIKIHVENLQLSTKNFDLGRRFIFQPDDHKHTFKFVTAWLQKKKITVPLWPSMSPDLNPTEILWNENKTSVNKSSSGIRTCNLFKFVQISPKTLENDYSKS